VAVDDNTFYHQILLVAFSTTVPRLKRDLRFDQELCAELLGILNWALDSLDCLLNLTYYINPTDVRAMPADQDASKCYDPPDDEYYYGYGCTIVLTSQKIPTAAEFTESKQAPSSSRFGWLVTAPTTRLTLMTTC
jgi:hypothetical protein